MLKFVSNKGHILINFQSKIRSNVIRCYDALFGKNGFSVQNFLALLYASVLLINEKIFDYILLDASV